MMECDCTDYSYAVRDGAQHIVQFQYKQRAAFLLHECRQHVVGNGTGLDPKWQAMGSHPGAFADVPGAIQTWHAAP